MSRLFSIQGSAHGIVLAAIAVLVSYGAALAGDHPYAGLWSEAGAGEAKGNDELSGPLGCYNRFTEQLPDGRFRYFLVDHAKWLTERKVEYLLAQEGTCTTNPDGKSETCVGQVMGEKQSKWFIAYQGAAADEVRATYYENVFYFEKRFNGEPIVRHRCPFDMAGIERYVSGRTIADCTTRCRAFGRSEIEEFKGMLQEIQGAQ